MFEGDKHIGRFEGMRNGLTTGLLRSSGIGHWLADPCSSALWEQELAVRNGALTPAERKARYVKIKAARELRAEDASLRNRPKSD